VLPEQCASIPSDFKEELERDWMDGLNKMFSEKEMAGSEVRAGAYPFM
jgi:hypothetical protein